MVVERAPATLPLPEIAPIPQHVAIIMDGNGRWAEARGLKRQQGHRAGADSIRNVIERFAAHGVQVLTLFAFSTENWGRPVAEVRGLMRLGEEFIEANLDALDAEGARLSHIGDLEGLPRPLRRAVRRAAERTAGNTRIAVNVAFNYGGRTDIVEAVRELVADGVRPEDVTEEAIACRLTTADLPDPDLMIRTGGERRISNFLVWQAAYTEYHFSPALWPDFGPAEVDQALLEFSRRRRRFGVVPGDGFSGQ